MRNQIQKTAGLACRFLLSVVLFLNPTVLSGKNLLFRFITAIRVIFYGCFQQPSSALCSNLESITPASIDLKQFLQRRPVPVKVFSAHQISQRKPFADRNLVVTADCSLKEILDFLCFCLGNGMNFSDFTILYKHNCSLFKIILRKGGRLDLSSLLLAPVLRKFRQNASIYIGKGFTALQRRTS